MDNLELFEQVRTVPEEAKKQIEGGRLNGMTDINPMWRIKKLTEIFGPAGVGWKTVIREKRIEQGEGVVKKAFVDIDLYIKTEDGWSDPIPGTGGSSFVENNKGGSYTNDECFKMAYTDAISVSCKLLGMGADVYWNTDDTKYREPDLQSHDIMAIQKRVQLLLSDKMRQRGIGTDELAKALGMKPKEVNEMLGLYNKLSKFEKAVSAL